jgi:rod shape-determining protein MreB
MAVISLGGIVVSRSVRVGGYEMDEAITSYMRGAHQLAIGSRTAEQIKISLGSVQPLEPEETLEVRGRHLVTGLPTAIELHSEEVRAAIMAPVREILRAIRDTLEETPPELASDIAKDGILLAGGGTLVRGFQELVADETGMPVYSAESPLTCVAFGSGQALAHFDQLSRASRHRVPSLTPDWRTA